MNPCHSLVRRLLRNRLFVCGGGLVLRSGLLALAAPALTRMGLLHDPVRQLEDGLKEDVLPRAPSARFWAGTGEPGCGLLARGVQGARVSPGMHRFFRLDIPMIRGTVWPDAAPLPGRTRWGECALRRTDPRVCDGPREGTT